MQMSLPGLRFVVRAASGRKEPTWMSRMPLRGHEWLLRGRVDCVSESGRAGSAGVPPAKLLERGKQAKMPMFSIISHPAPRLEDRTASFHFSLVTCHCARRALRHPAAPLRMESGRGEKDKLDKGGQSCGKGGGRDVEGRNLQEYLEWRYALKAGSGRNAKGKEGDETGTFVPFHISLPAMSGT